MRGYERDKETPIQERGECNKGLKKKEKTKGGREREKKGKVGILNSFQL